PSRFWWVSFSLTAGPGSTAGYPLYGHGVVVGDGDPVGAEVHGHRTARRAPAQLLRAGRAQHCGADVGGGLLADEPLRGLGLAGAAAPAVLAGGGARGQRERAETSRNRPGLHDRLLQVHRE